MDEEVVIDLFNRAQSKGYTKSIEDFKLLLETDEDVIVDNFNYVKSKGYAKPIEDFKVLVKKKDETTGLVSPQEEVVTTSVTEEVETPGVSDVSVSEEVVEETPELPKYLQQAFEPKTEDKSFNEAIATVVLDDIDKDEETLVPELLEKFNKYGFSFQYAGTPGDAITVYDYDGNPLEVDLQTFTSAGKQEEYNKLIQFLNNNRRDPKKIQQDLDAEAEDFKYLADREDKDTESSLLFPQVKTSKTGQITTGPLSVISSLLSSQEKEDAFVVAQRANKYITAGGEKYKQQDFDRLFEQNVKALDIGDDGKPSAAAVNQAAYDAKIQQRVNAQEDFINTLSPERKALAEALKAVRDAQRAGASKEDINGLKQKFNDLYNIDAQKLYNFDGTYIEEGNAPDEVVAFNNQVEEGAIEKHKSYTPEELEDLQVDLLYKTIFSAKKINDHKGKIFKGLGIVEGLVQQVKLDVGSLVDGESYKFGFNTGTASIATDEIRKVAETGRITETLPLLPGNSPLVQEYNNNVKQLLEVQGALALNYNPSTLEEEGYFSPLKALAVSAYETATGQDVRVADDMVKAYVSAREDAGLKVTDKDKQRAEDSILDEGMSAVGSIIPLIGEIALTKKAINLTGALKNMQILTRGAQIRSKSPYTRVAIGLISSGAQEALVFKSTGVLSEQLVSGSGEGMTGTMGAGFGLGQYGGNFLTKALLGTRSPLLQGILTPIQKSRVLRGVFNGTANATVGTGALYGAEFFDTMVNTDKGFLESVNEVLDVGGTWEMKDGKPTYTGGSPIKKLLVSFSTMGALGLGNAKGWKNMYDAMRSDIKNYKPMEPSEYAKAVETLGLDPKKQYTAEEIKKAYRTKVKENPRTKEELADPEKNKKAKEIISAYEKLTDNEGMLLAQEQIKKEEGYKKKKRELFFMANRMKNNVEFTGKEYELDYKDAEVIKDLSIGELEALTEDLKNQGISGQDAFNLQGKVQTARNHLKTINDVGITEPGARKRVYDLLNKFTEADRKLEELKTKAKTSKANEALFSEKIKQQEAEVKGITDNLQKEITKTEKDAVQEQTTEEGVLRLEGKEPTEQVGLQEVGQPQQKVTTEVKEEVETPTTEVTEEVEIKTETVDTQGRPAKAGARLFNDPNPETAEISAKYKQDKGIETSAGENITELDIDNAMEIADIYEAMEDNPSDPEVQEAYNALAKETVDQYSAMTEAGYEIEIYEGKGEPYANSQEMIDDLKNNKHMYIFSTEGGFGEAGITEQQRKENAMLQDSGFKDKNGKPLLINDLFRGVHDFFGHSERGNSFGAKGEENAWDVHARMFTDKARRAMTAETRGQNSWVNFGPQMRNEKGDIIKKGEPGYLGPKERAFAPQKMGLLPESYSEITETPTTEVKEEVSKQEMEDMDRVISGDTDVQFRKKPKFRKEGTEPRDEVEADVEALLSVPDVELVNKKLDLSLVESPSVELDITDMKSRPGLRDDIDIKEVEIKDFLGLPVGLTISDQLTVGDVPNPYTGNVIKNNKGGLGFGFTPGNKGLGWTYVDLKTSGNYWKYYREIYDKNPEPFDKAWEEGRLPKGHIPVFIIKMGPNSMKSNQKVFSVLADNIKKLPKKNKVAALKALKQDLINAKEVLTKDVERGSSIKTGEEYKETTLNNKIEEIKIYEEILQTIDKNKYKTLDELVDDVATKYKLFTLDQRKTLIGRITSGAPNVPGEAPKKPGKSKKPVSSALLEGRPKEDYPLLHLGSIMDVVTEPITKDVPERHVIGVTAIDIFSEPVASDHPNYKGGLKGQMLGVVKNTAHLKDIYPAAYGNVIEKAIRKEESEKKVKPITEGTAISQGISLTMGLTDIPLRGQTISQRLGEREKLIGFLGQAFPATTWFTDPVTWERVLSSDGVKQYVKNGEIVYGITRGGDIYLNPKFRDLNTPIHEAGHILLDYYEVNHPELFKKGMKLVEGTKELKEAIAELGDNVKARKEALATLIGNEGETLSGDKKKRFKEWLLQLWKALKAKFPSLRKLTPKEISNLTLEDFIGGSLKDIFSGRAITRDKVRSTERKDIDIHFRKGDNIYDIVRRLRNAGFETGKIKVALKSKGYDRKEILKAVEVPVDILRNLPESFGNIKGGINEGIKLYESVLKEMKKPSNKKLPIEQNLDKGIEFLKKQEAFIAEGDTYKVKGEDKIKKEMSTQQKQMIIDFERSVGMKSSRRLRAEVSNLKKAIRERKAGERDIKKIQSELRLFMRKTLPTAEYKKSEVTSLISKINKATKFNIDKLMDEVFDLAVKKNVQITESNITSIINGKYDKVEGGRLKGTKISTDAKDRLDRIKSLIAPTESSIEKIQEINNKLNNRFNELSEKTKLTDEQLDEMVDIETATYYNSARLLENTDLGKLNDLYTVENNLIELIERGKTERKAQLQRQHEYYKDIVSDAYKDITGVELDVSEEGKKKRDKQMRSYREKMKNKMSNRIKATGIKVVKGLEKFVVLHEDFTGLIDMISKSTGEMFGGRLQELTTDRIDDASYEFKQRKEEVTKLLFDNIERIYGKDWKKKIRKNRIKENTGANLETGEEIRLSQDEAYYLYNQYKDPANHPGFETKYGEGYKEIMDKITKFLKPEVKEWADWQVDVLFPELYKRYNEVYKRIHRTNMPWNSKYAGRIKRQDVDLEPLDLLEANTKYATSIGGASTKMRIKNAKAIEEVNGNDMLFTYLQDMEFFAAYAEPLRDIDKILKNKDIRNAIKMTGGEQALTYAEKILDKVATRGIDKGGEAKILNWMTDAFVTSRLGFNPVVGIKQLTSAIAYIPEIGIENWVKYGAPMANIFKLRKIWKEITDNSVYIRDRYAKDIRRTLESYSEKDMVEVIPQSFGNKTIDVFMYLIKTGDKGGIMGGIPNYLYYKDIYKKKNPKASEQDAINYAIKRFQKTTKKTQQSGDIQDKDMIQLTKSRRFLTMFMTSVKQYQRKINSAIRQLYRKTRGKASKGSLRENLATFFMYHTLLPVFFHYIGLGLPGLLTNWDDEDRDALGMTSILGVLNSFVILGDMIETARELYEGKPWAADIKSAPPVFTIISSIADNISKYTKAKTEETKSKYLNKLLIELGTFAKLPAGNIKKLYDNYSKVIKGETKDIKEDILRLFNFSDYVIEEKGNKKSKKEGAKLQELLGKPKKTSVIKDAELEDVELEDVELEDVEFED